jgi:hypothetical protein
MLLHKLFCNLFIFVRCGPIANKGGYLFKVAWLMMTAGRREERKKDIPKEPGVQIFNL